MKSAHTAGAVLVLALFASACVDDTDTTDDLDIPPASETVTPTPIDDMPARTIAFTALGGSPLMGDVEVEGDDSNTDIAVTIRNSADGAVHKGHIHTGTCDAPGAVVVPLDDVTIDSDLEGESDTSLDLPLATVMNGEHIVAYHEAGGDPGTPVVCAAIPARASM